MSLTRDINIKNQSDISAIISVALSLLKLVNRMVPKLP